MQEIQPEETQIKGRWVLADARMQGDAVCSRIEWLVMNHLKELNSNSKRESLYIDLSDNRYWLRVYPESFRHGGGPPLLKCLAKSDALLWQMRQAHERNWS